MFEEDEEPRDPFEVAENAFFQHPYSRARQVVYKQMESGYQTCFYNAFEKIYPKTESFPYLILPIDGKPVKLLVDSGSAKSFISPDFIDENIVQELTRSLIEKLGGYEVIITIAHINPFPESIYSSNLPFFVYKFHEYFDGLLGSAAFADTEAFVDTDTNQIVFFDTFVQMLRTVPEYPDDY